MSEDLTECQDSSHQQHLALTGITQHLGLGRNNPTPAGSSQILFPCTASGVSFPSDTNCNGKQKSGEKGVPVAGDVPYFPQRRLQPPRGAFGRGVDLNSDRAAPKPQGTCSGTPTGMGSLLPVLHPTLTSSSLEGSSKTQNRVMRTGRSSCLMLLKSSISCSSHKLFSFMG